MLVNIANEQAKEHDVHIIVINDLCDEGLVAAIGKSVHFHCLMRKLKSRSVMPVVRLNMLLLKLHPDVIHAHIPSIVSLLLPVFRDRLCLTLHDVLPKNSKSVKYFGKPRKLFAISASVRQSIREQSRFDADIVPNGIRPELISHSPHKRNDVFRIVQVSRLEHKKKGQHILIKAVRKIVDKGYKAFTVDLIGEGRSLSYLESLVAELGLHDYVHFLGARSQHYIFEHLHEYDLFVQPSIFEGFGLTVAEAMAAGVPVLVSANQGPLEIIGNGAYGYSFKNRDVDDCAGKIEQFLTCGISPDKIKLAYKRVNEYYNVKNTASTYIAKYKEMAGTKS